MINIYREEIEKAINCSFTVIDWKTGYAERPAVTNVGDKWRVVKSMHWLRTSWFKILGADNCYYVFKIRPISEPSNFDERPYYPGEKTLIKLKGAPHKNWFLRLLGFKQDKIVYSHSFNYLFV